MANGSQVDNCHCKVKARLNSRTSKPEHQKCKGVKERTEGLGKVRLVRLVRLG